MYDYIGTYSKLDKIDYKKNILFIEIKRNFE